MVICRSEGVEVTGASTGARAHAVDERLLLGVRQRIERSLREHRDACRKDVTGEQLLLPVSTS